MRKLTRKEVANIIIKATNPQEWSKEEFIIHTVYKVWNTKTTQNHDVGDEYDYCMKHIARNMDELDRLYIEFLKSDKSDKLSCDYEAKYCYKDNLVDEVLFIDDEFFDGVGDIISDRAQFMKMEAKRRRK